MLSYFKIMCCLVLSLSLSSLARATESPDLRCTTINSDPDIVLVETCESDESYIFRFPMRTETYDKQAYRAQIRNLVANWQRNSGFDQVAIENTNLEIWLSVPDTDPEGAQLRVQGFSAHGTFLVYLDFDPDRWPSTASRVGILNKILYPENFGYEAGRLIVAVKSQSTDDELQKVFAGYRWQRIAANEVVLACVPFAEQSTRTELMARDRAYGYMTSIQYNSWYEWMAYRGKAFTFAAMSR